MNKLKGAEKRNKTQKYGGGGEFQSRAAETVRWMGEEEQRVRDNLYLIYVYKICKSPFGIGM